MGGGEHKHGEICPCPLLSEECLFCVGIVGWKLSTIERVRMILCIVIRTSAQPDPLSGLWDAVLDGRSTPQRRGPHARVVCPSASFSGTVPGDNGHIWSAGVLRTACLQGTVSLPGRRGGGHRTRPSGRDHNWRQWGIQDPPCRGRLLPAGDPRDRGGSR